MTTIRTWKRRFENLQIASATILIASLLLSLAIIERPPDNPWAFGFCGVSVFTGSFAFTVSCINLRRLERGD